MSVYWICLDCKQVFYWIRKGVETRPRCPKCGSENVDAIEG